MSGAESRAERGAGMAENDGAGGSGAGGCGRGATTPEKLRGTKVWVTTPGACGPCLAKGRVECGRGSPSPALRVQGYDPWKICENSEAKSCILVTTCCEISCFLKTTAKKLGDQYIVGPQPKSTFRFPSHYLNSRSGRWTKNRPDSP